MTPESILQLSPTVALVVALNIFGTALKKSPISNWLIPYLLLLAGAIVYPLIADPKLYVTVTNPLALKTIHGFLIGGCSTGIHQAFRQFADRPKKVDGSTELITTPNDKKLDELK